MRARPLLAGFLAALLVAASCGGEIETDAAAGDSTVPAPASHGVWRTLPDAPIGTRPFAVSGWSGTEALFWAGSTLQRTFANTRGAAYDPASDSWRELPVPGWGHPGLTGIAFEGQLYVAAKGFASRLDVSDGSEFDLPHVQGFVLAKLVATDDAVWAVGPVDFASEDSIPVGIARYDPEADAWLAGPVFDGVPEMGGLFQDDFFADQPVLWTGSEIIVWNPAGRGLAFDPGPESWWLLPALPVSDGQVVDSEVAIAGDLLIALVEFEREGVAGHGIAAWDGETWSWKDIEISVTDFATVAIAGAPNWIAAFSPDQPPHTIHVPTGDSMRHDDAPIPGMQLPNIVWTGAELIVWGGVLTRTDDNPDPPDGAVWTPPLG